MCLEREKPDSRDLVVVDGPYMGCNVGIIESDSILPIELIEELKVATYKWILCEYRQPLYLMAFGEPVLQKEVQLRSVNFKQMGGQKRRVECIWTSESYKAYLAKSGTNRDTSRLARPVPADRPDTYYADLSLEELRREIKEGMTVISGSRLQMNAEMRNRLLPALLALRKLTYRKRPGYYEMLRSIGLNGDTVRQWFYRSSPADEVIDLAEEKRPEPVRHRGRPEPKPETEPQDIRDIYIQHLDKIVDALQRDKIALAKRLATEYLRVREGNSERAA